MSKVYVIGTCDTKEAELRYAVERVRAAGARCRAGRYLDDAQLGSGRRDAGDGGAASSARVPMLCWAMPTGAVR